jgi:hypothetical protein
MVVTGAVGDAALMLYVPYGEKGYVVCLKSSVNGTRKQTKQDTNKFTLLAFKIIAILHNTLLATFIKLLETVSKGLFRNRSQNRCHTFLEVLGGEMGFAGRLDVIVI